MDFVGCGKVRETYKNILVLILELVLCVFAIGNCIYHWINNPGENSIGTSNTQKPIVIWVRSY